MAGTEYFGRNHSSTKRSHTCQHHGIVGREKKGSGGGGGGEIDSNSVKTSQKIRHEQKTQ